mmetsp:Transcript_16330/g.35449  ORF Transcript_16330/g.35449 Transcript_16330/m.35449 type:complete len:253 (-) Transcript_16330:490-1248(-)
MAALSHHAQRVGVARVTRAANLRKLCGALHGRAVGRHHRRHGNRIMRKSIHHVHGHPKPPNPSRLCHLCVLPSHAPHADSHVRRQLKLHRELGEEARAEEEERKRRRSGRRSSCSQIGRREEERLITLHSWNKPNRAVCIRWLLLLAVLFMLRSSVERRVFECARCAVAGAGCMTSASPILTDGRSCVRTWALPLEAFRTQNELESESPPCTDSNAPNAANSCGLAMTALLEYLSLSDDDVAGASADSDTEL